MRVNKIINKTYAEGPGCRFCIWVQGCNHRCDGCFAVDLWDFNGGYEISTHEIISQIDAVKSDICGVTFLGGEPFEYADELAVIARYIHSINKNVISFTGYTYEALKENKNSLLSETDLLIDGKFEEMSMDYSRPLVGSSNQRFIFLTDSSLKYEMDNYKNCFEIRISQNGRTEINGMGNIETIKKHFKNYRRI